MTYFEHTKADLARERAAGIVETRREIGEWLLALADDTSRKMNGETATDPEAEREYDRGYLLEDILSRLAEFAGNYVPDAATLFPSVVDNKRAVPAYPMLIEATMTETGAEEDTIDLSDAIREAWLAQTFDNGYPRHEHVGMPDERCLADIRSIYSTGPAIRCGRYYGHNIHETDFETRTK